MENAILTLIKEQFFITIYLIVLLERLKRQSNRSLFTSWLVNITGTILHEASHFIVAFLLGAKPKTFSLIPKKNIIDGNSYYTLGSVEVRNLNNFNAFPIGMSPFLLIIILYFFNAHFFEYFEDTLYSNILFIFITIILIDSSIPSIVDFKQAFKGYGYAIYLLLLVLLVVFIYKGQL